MQNYFSDQFIQINVFVGGLTYYRVYTNIMNVIIFFLYI